MPLSAFYTGIMAASVYRTHPLWWKKGIKTESYTLDFTVNRKRCFNQNCLNYFKIPLIKHTQNENTLPHCLMLPIKDSSWVYFREQLFYDVVVTLIKKHKNAILDLKIKKLTKSIMTLTRFAPMEARQHMMT